MASPCDIGLAISFLKLARASEKATPMDHQRPQGPEDEITMRDLVDHFDVAGFMR